MGSGAVGIGGRPCSVLLWGQGRCRAKLQRLRGPAAPHPSKGVEGRGGGRWRFQVQGNSDVAAAEETEL